MIEFFKNIFRSHNTSLSHEAKEQTSENTNALTILLGDDNEPYIHVAITDVDDDKAILFAKMLYELNTGKYITSIVNILNELSSRDDKIKTFVHKLIINWRLHEQLDKEQSVIYDEPLVRPSDFFKGLKHE
jgi:hypothetical protein